MSLGSTEECINPDCPGRKKSKAATEEGEQTEASAKEAKPAAKKKTTAVRKPAKSKAAKKKTEPSETE